MTQLTRGVGADKPIVTADIVHPEVVQSAFDVLRKGGTEVIAGLADPTKLTVQLSGSVMTLFEKTVKGTLFGSSNPMYDINKLFGLYRSGDLKLDELVTRKLLPGRDQPWLSGHARRKEHPRRHRPPELTGGPLTLPPHQPI